MQAILTTYTNDERFRPVIDARCGDKHVRVAYDTSLGLDDNHVTAALQLANSLGWRYEWAFAILQSGDYCHVPLRPDRHYSSVLAVSPTSPAESWRGRSGISTARRLTPTQPSARR